MGVAVQCVSYEAQVFYTDILQIFVRADFPSFRIVILDVDVVHDRFVESDLAVCSGFHLMKFGDFYSVQVVGALVDGDRGFCYRPVLVEGNRTDFLLYQFPVSAAQAQLYPLSGGDSGGSADFHGKVSAHGILGYGSELGGVTGIVRTVGVLDCQQYR